MEHLTTKGSASRRNARALFYPPIVRERKKGWQHVALRHETRSSPVHEALLACPRNPRPSFNLKLSSFLVQKLLQWHFLPPAPLFSPYHLGAKKHGMKWGRRFRASVGIAGIIHTVDNLKFNAREFGGLGKFLPSDGMSVIDSCGVGYVFGKNFPNCGAM